MPVVRPVSPEAAAILRDKVAVAVQPVANLPAEGGERLAAAMAVALRNEGVAADIDPQGPSYTLAGIANVREVPNELEIKISWFLLDPKGLRIAQQDQITRGRVEDWIEGNDRLISRIANTNAKPVASMVGLHTGQPGPVRAVAAAPQSAAETPANGARPGEKPGAKPAPPAAGAPPATTQQAAATPAKPVVLRIVVPRVTGAPGDGPDSLTAGMKRALGRRNFAIVAKPEPNSLTVRGKVEMKPFNNGREVITITWAVLDSKNNQVGEIEQSNVIPSGSLNGEWGPIAREITVAAAEGLLDLLEKASKAARE
ncbi:MAG: hypothetical protein K0S54_1170 [Alphaproteobacteria bacterium]|nr:hypothetical protein [Alphaproteobacteria bacterium]